MALSWFSRRTKPAAVKARRARPRLEPLEDRRLLSGGALDPTFGNGGTVVTAHIGSGATPAVAEALQPDGKIVAVGTSNAGQVGKAQLVIARYNADGSLDASFATGGVFVGSSPLGDERGQAVAVLPSGKILVAGTAPNPDGTFVDPFGNHRQNFGLYRFNADGTPDTTFGSGGVVTTAFNTDDNSVAFALLVQADGKVVLAGSTASTPADPPPGYDVFALARYNADGTLDTTFGSGGKVTYNVNANSGLPYLPNAAHALVEQADGKYVAAGASFFGGNKFALVRFTSGGAVDPTFGNGGRVETQFLTGSSDTINAAVVQPDGKIVVGGESADSTLPPGPGLALARYNPDGTLDTTFGSGGLVRDTFNPGFVGAGGLVLLPGGGLAVGGDGDPNGQGYTFLVEEYLPNGQLDPSFGTGGRVFTPFPGQSAVQGYTILRQPDGKLVVSGDAYDSFALARYLGQGPAAVFVVAPGQPTDSTHFTSLAAALTGVAAGGTVTVEPGAVADPAAVSVTQAVTIQGDPNVPGSILPAYDLNLQASGVTLRNLNLGAVTIAAGVGNETVARSYLVSLTETGGTASGGGGNQITQDVFAGPVVLGGNTSGATNDVVFHNTFAGFAGTMLSLSDDGGASVRDNVFQGGADGQTALSVTDSTGVVVANNTVSLPGTSLATVGIALANPAGGVMAVTVQDNAIATGAGRGLALTAGNDANLQALVQGNDFHNNAVGVDYAGAGGGPLGSDLGGGPLGGLGGNNFRGFTAPGTATAAAVYLHGVGAAAVLHAQQNLFAQGVTPSTVVVAAAGTVDVGAPLGAAQAFVQTLYTGLLGRTGTPAELNSWAGVYASSGQGAVVGGILRSAEALGRVVDGLYLRFLGRAADPGGRAFWVGRLAGGEPLEDVQAGFLASPEFLASSDTDYVQALYRAVLGRTGSAQELAAWNGLLPQLGLGGVAAAFTHSAENRNRFVIATYDNFLHRDPSAGEVAGWAGQPSDLLGVEQGILDLPEFFTNG